MLMNNYKTSHLFVARCIIIVASLSAIVAAWAWAIVLISRHDYLTQLCRTYRTLHGLLISQFAFLIASTIEAIIFAYNANENIAVVMLEEKV
jgi:hypothetical protein